MSKKFFERVAWRGVTVNVVTRQQLRLVEADLGHPLVATQGSYRPFTSYSADTHTGGMAIDLDVRGYSTAKIKRVVKAMRQRGFAAWYRDKGFDIPHIHGILIASSSDASPGALAQIGAYRKGRDGLKGNAVDTWWKPSPVPVITALLPARIDVEFTTFNVAGKRSNHPARISRMCRSGGTIREGEIIGLQECYSPALAVLRAELVTRTKKRMRVAAAYKGRVIVYDSARWKRVDGSKRSFTLPNGKSAVGIKLMHRQTGKFLNIISAHLSHQHGAGVLRQRETESLINQVKGAYPDHHTIYLMDANSSLKSIKTRPVDHVGKAMRARGYYDAYSIADARGHESHNSAGARSGARHGVHIDRIFVGGKIDVKKWRLEREADERRECFDHYPITAHARIDV